MRPGADRAFERGLFQGKALWALSPRQGDLVKERDGRGKRSDEAEDNSDTTEIGVIERDDSATETQRGRQRGKRGESATLAGTGKRRR